MKKTAITVVSVLGVIVLMIVVLNLKYIKEYFETTKRIKNSDTYTKNSVKIEYISKTYNVKIPQGLGDMQLKGNVSYCFKTTKSVNKIQKEFKELYGAENVQEKNEEFYYTNKEDKYVIIVRYDGGLFTDVNITDVKTIE